MAIEAVALIPQKPPPIYGTISFYLAVLGGLGLLHSRTRSLGALLWLILASAGGALAWERVCLDQGSTANFINLRKVWKENPKHDLRRLEVAYSHVPFGVVALWIFKKYAKETKQPNLKRLNISI